MIIRTVQEEPVSLEFGELATDGNSVYLGTGNEDVPVAKLKLVSLLEETTEVGFNNSVPVGAIVPLTLAHYPLLSDEPSFEGVSCLPENSAAGVEEWLSCLGYSGWVPCDGRQLNNSCSPIFNGTGKYMPDLTGGRFLRGTVDAMAGTIGGPHMDLTANNLTNSHTHCGASYCVVGGKRSSAPYNCLVFNSRPPENTQTFVATWEISPVCGFSPGGGTITLNPIMIGGETGSGNSVHSHSLEMSQLTPQYMDAIYIMKVE